MRKEAENWLKSSDYDLETAKIMLDTGRYSYCVFMCHQAIEKLLKVLIINIKKEIPNRTHNLRILLVDAGLEIPKDQENKIIRLNPHYMISRYPDVAGGPNFEMYNSDVAKEFLNDSQEVITWLKQIYL